MSDETEARDNRPGYQDRVNTLQSGGSNVARTGVGVIILAALAMAAVYTFSPGAIGGMLTSGPSESEDMQETTTADPTIDTEFDTQVPPETEPVDTADPFQDTETGPTPEDQRIAALEQQLRDLQNAPASDGNLDTALEQQRQQLRDEFASEREALQQQIDELRNRPVQLREANVIPGLGVGGETDEERRARERLEERA